MSDSLKDQLMALGLAKEKPARKPRKSRHHKHTRPATRKADKSQTGDISLDQAYRIRKQEEKSTAERTRKLKQEEQMRRRILNGKIKELAEKNRLNDPKAELKRNFLFKGRIRSVLVTPEQLQQLNDGALALVFVRGHYIVVTPAVAEEVRKLSPDHVPDLDGGADDGEHPVPDDLVW